MSREIVALTRAIPSGGDKSPAARGCCREGCGALPRCYRSSPGGSRIIAAQHHAAGASPVGRGLARRGTPASCRRRVIRGSSGHAARLPPGGLPRDGVESERLAALVDDEVAQSVRAGDELAPRAAGQPRDRFCVQVERAQLPVSPAVS
jgi:hypothetical protein